MVIAIGTGGLGYLIISFIPYYNDRISDPFIPTAVLYIYNALNTFLKIFVLIGLIIGEIFLSVFSTSCITMHECYTIDREIQFYYYNRKNFAQ